MEMSTLPYACETRDPDQTMAVASSFAGMVEPGEVVLLSGSLGAGKTHFARGFCKGLGMKELWEVDSPTYTVVNHYDVGRGVDHIDLYRFHSSADLDDIDFEDILAADSIKLIEWPERLDNYPIDSGFLVRIEATDENHRRLSISRLNAQDASS